MTNYLAYIDPGTGSMLLTVILSVVTALVFAFRGIFIKLKVKIFGGKIADKGKEKVPFVIYSDSKRYWNVFKPICDELEKRQKECLYLTASPDDPALKETYKYIKSEFIGEGNKGFARLNMLRANIVLATTPGLDVLQWKRSKDVDWYVHIYHSVDDCLGYRMFGLDYYDAVLKAGDIQERAIRTLEKIRNLPAKETVLVGSTYMDSMMAKKKMLSQNEKENSLVTVLLAPSWGKNSILNKYGSSFIQKLVDTGYKIIVRPHPQSKISESQMLTDLKNKFPENELFEWNEDNDNFNVLSQADLMISDYSGVMFDYTFIFDKPLIYTEVLFDTNEFDAAWVDYNMWSFSILPQLGHELKEEDFDYLKEKIDKTLCSQEYRDGRKKAIEEAWQYRGEAAIRTVDYLIEKYDQIINKTNSEK